MPAFSERARQWLTQLREDPGEALATVLSDAISELILTEHTTAVRLSRLEGRVMAVGIRDTEHVVHVSLGEAGVRLMRGENVRADVRITGRAADFIAYARAKRRGDSIGAGRIEISGDLQTAQDVQALLGDLVIDWEAMLSRYVGGVAAHQIGRIVRAAGEQAAVTAQRLEQDLSEYLRAETQLLPTRREVEMHNRAAFDLADDVERFEARLERLENSRKR